MICTPHAISHGSLSPLGAQAGQAGVARVLAQAGFSQADRVAETPFNLVLHARP